MGKPNLKSARFIFSKRFLVTLLVVLLLIASGTAIYFYSGSSENDFKLPSFNTEEDSSSVEPEELVNKVGNKFLLPEEIPTIATVSDKTQLTDQQFFAKAENGDKVLIYRDSGIAIIYRPSIDKIINVGPVQINEEGIQGTDQVQDTEGSSEVGVLILNGTTTVGLTQVAVNELEALEFMTVEDRLDTAVKPYESSMVVYSSEEFMEQAEIIASSLSAELTSELPEDEQSTSDITIILGNDYASNSSE